MLFSDYDLWCKSTVKAMSAISAIPKAGEQTKFGLFWSDIRAFADSASYSSRHNYSPDSRVRTSELSSAFLMLSFAIGWTSMLWQTLIERCKHFLHKKLSPFKMTTLLPTLKVIEKHGIRTIDWMGIQSTRHFSLDTSAKHSNESNLCLLSNHKNSSLIQNLTTDEIFNNLMSTWRTYLKLENHLTSWAVLFLLNLMSGKNILRMAELG